MNKNNLSDNHKLNNLRVIIPFSNFLDSRSFFDIQTRNEILEFLDTKISLKVKIQMASGSRLGIIILTE